MMSESSSEGRIVVENRVQRRAAASRKGWNARKAASGARQAASRACGECSLCCRLLPVPPLDKGAGERCRHQRHGKGCAVHATLDQPFVCRAWRCAWLMGAPLPRPDRVGFVVDPMPDFVTLGPEPGKGQKQPCIQVWVANREAHRDLALRRYLARLGEQSGLCAIVRFDAVSGFLLVPPALSETGDWLEIAQTGSGPPHRLEEIVATVNNHKREAS